MASTSSLVRTAGPAVVEGARGGAPLKPTALRRRVLAMVAGMSMLAACAVNPTLRPLSPDTPVSPRIEDDHVLVSDGARLGLQSWKGEGEADVILLAVHGMSAYGDSFYSGAPYWAARGIHVYAYDQRGFGRSPGRGLWAGSDLMAADLQDVIAALRALYPDLRLVVLGESMGGATVLNALAREDGVDADAIILSAPALRGWSTLPVLYKLSLGFTARLFGAAAVEPPRRLVQVQATDNIDALIKNANDPLFLKTTRFDTLHGLVEHMERARRAPLPQAMPLLLLYGSKDELIPRAPTEALAARLGPCARSVEYPLGWHMLFHDLQAETVWHDVAAFARDPFAPLPSGLGGILGDKPAPPLRDLCIGGPESRAERQESP